jgi:UDP-N-acetylmuramate--alanine ligase
MRIYFAGLGGVGIGPLAEIALDAGHDIAGSDLSESLMTTELIARGVAVHIGEQTGDYLRDEHAQEAFDWFVHTAALPEDHKELVAARALGIRTAKRDEFLAHIIAEKNLQLIAIAGTHGKTTTTGMMIWAMKQLGVPVSYSVGTTISFGPSGHYDPASEYFVYECDEFDRNMLQFHPHLSLLTSLDYDHPDTYPTKEDYTAAFSQFLQQSSHTIGWKHDLENLGNAASWQLTDDEVMAIALPGEHSRQNATLVAKACEYLKFPSAIDALNTFPGTNRRFEKLGDNLYTDYGHHPVEIAATLQMARELSDHVVLVYQPHQNVRQHEVRAQYTNCFELASEVYWLPTYLSREDENLEILTPQQLAMNVTNTDSVQYVELNDNLWEAIQQHRANGHLVLCMGAGLIDAWVRSHIDK